MGESGWQMAGHSSYRSKGSVSDRGDPGSRMSQFESDVVS
jgi:hypothetical protein